MPRKSAGWTAVSWDSGAAPQDDPSVARNPSTLSGEWSEWMRRPGIEWKSPSVVIDESGEIDNSQPAAARKRIGNVVRRHATQYDLYSRRKRRGSLVIEDRPRPERGYARSQALLKVLCPGDEEGPRRDHGGTIYDCAVREARRIAIDQCAQWEPDASAACGADSGIETCSSLRRWQPAAQQPFCCQQPAALAVIAVRQ